MGRRDLLTDDERRALFSVPSDHDTMVRFYTLSRADIELVRTRRGDANRLGAAVQLALLRHPGFGFAIDSAPPGLVAFMAAQIEVPASAIAEYGVREQTTTDHARLLMNVMGVRPSGRVRFPADDCGRRDGRVVHRSWLADRIGHRGRPTGRPHPAADTRPTGTRRDRGAGTGADADLCGAAGIFLDRPAHQA